MTLQHTSNSESQQQKPAQESSKASGVQIVGRYMTQGGVVGAEIRVSRASGRFAYTGAWGAGSGLDEESMRASLRSMLQRRRGVVVSIPFAAGEVK